MSEKKKNKVTLDCDDGPCALPKSAAVTTGVIVEARESGDNLPGTLKVTLAKLDKTKTLEPVSTEVVSRRLTIATFKGVEQGWYRALAVRNVAGKPEFSAARNVQVVKIKGPGSEEPQHVLLTLAAQGVAKFVFVDDLDGKPLAGATVIFRHPDGTEQRHSTDGAGEIRIAGGNSEVFTVVRLEHPDRSSVAAVKHEAVE